MIYSVQIYFFFLSFQLLPSGAGVDAVRKITKQSVELFEVCTVKAEVSGGGKVTKHERLRSFQKGDDFFSQSFPPLQTLHLKYLQKHLPK